MSHEQLHHKISLSKKFQFKVKFATNFGHLTSVIN